MIPSPDPIERPFTNQGDSEEVVEIDEHGNVYPPEGIVEIDEHGSIRKRKPTILRDPRGEYSTSTRGNVDESHCIATISE